MWAPRKRLLTSNEGFAFIVLLGLSASTARFELEACSEALVGTLGVSRWVDNADSGPLVLWGEIPCAIAFKWPKEFLSGESDVTRASAGVLFRWCSMKSRFPFRDAWLVAEGERWFVWDAGGPFAQADFEGSWATGFMNYASREGKRSKRDGVSHCLCQFCVAGEQWVIGNEYLQSKPASRDAASRWRCPVWWPHRLGCSHCLHSLKKSEYHVQAYNFKYPSRNLHQLILRNSDSKTVI